MYRELQSRHDDAVPQDLVHCTAMVTHAEQSTINKTPALRTVIFAVALVVFAVLNPLACVWHCALQKHIPKQDQRYVWICTALQQPGAGDVIVDGAGSTAQLSGGAPISAVHHGVIIAAAGAVLALLVTRLVQFTVLVRRTSAPIVPLAPPPKSLLRFS